MHFQLLYKMPLRKTGFLALILLLGKGRAEESDSGSCRLSSEFPSPEVFPWDTKSIKVSWDKVFVNCQKKEVKSLQLKVETAMGGVTDTITNDAIFEDNEIILDRRPCITHTVHIKLDFKDEGKLPLESTTSYNKNSGRMYTSKDLYSGRLDTEVVQNVCLKQSSGPPIVTIPDPPEALSGCQITNGDQVLELDTVPIGATIEVKIRVENPFGRAGTVPVISKVKNIQNCTVCEVKDKFGLLARAHNSSHLHVSWEDAFQGCKSFEV